MRWLRKILSVAVVIGVAALMSIPFKRVPPRETNKNTGRGQWEFVEPRLQLQQILKADPAHDHGPSGSGSNAAGGQDAAAIGDSGDRFGSPGRASGDLAPNSTPTRLDGSSASSTSDSGSQATSPGGSTNDASSRGDRPASSGRGRSSARPIPNDDAPPIRDQEAYPMSPMSRMPRIEADPPRVERLGESTSPPALPGEFQPLGDSTP